MIIIINVCIKASYYSSFMLCSFGTSTEASAPAVLSFVVFDFETMQCMQNMTRGTTWEFPIYIIYQQIPR